MSAVEQMLTWQRLPLLSYLPLRVLPKWIQVFSYSCPFDLFFVCVLHVKFL